MKTTFYHIAPDSFRNLEDQSMQYYVKDHGTYAIEMSGAYTVAELEEKLRMLKEANRAAGCPDYPLI